LDLGWQKDKTITPTRCFGRWPRGSFVTEHGKWTPRARLVSDQEPVATKVQILLSSEPAGSNVVDEIGSRWIS